MIHTQQTRSQQTTPKNSWTNFPFGEMSKEPSYGATVLMGNHLFVFAHGHKDSKHKVINLHNNSVQTCWGFSFGDADDNYSLTKYGENQIIKFGGEAERKATNELVLMTISSFNHDNAPNVSGHTAAIYQDCLYLFGGRNRGTESSANNKLWCYDLKIGRWKLCDTIGKGPKAREGAKSWVRGDNLYIYGGFSRLGKNRVSYSELFELNLKSMKWRKIEQKDPKSGRDSEFFERFSANIYGDNILILKNETKDKSDQLYCCNRRDLSSWSTLDAKGFEGMRTLGNSVIYNNMLYVCATKNAAKNQLFLASLQLDDLLLAKSPEEKHFNSLFMKESVSDLKLKVKDEIIPTHKNILAQKSQYFANFFDNSPSQKVIEIDSYKENSHSFIKGLYKKYGFHFDLPLSEYDNKHQENSIPTRECSTTIESEAESTSPASRRDQKDRAQRKVVNRIDPSSYYYEEEERQTWPVLKKNKQF